VVINSIDKRKSGGRGGGGERERERERMSKLKFIERDGTTHP